MSRLERLRKNLKLDKDDPIPQAEREAVERSISAINDSLPEPQDLGPRSRRQAPPIPRSQDQAPEGAYGAGQASEAFEPDLADPEQEAQLGAGRRLRKRKKKGLADEVDPEIDPESGSDVEAKVLDFQQTAPPRWPGGLERRKEDGSLRNLGVGQPDVTLLASLFNTNCVIEEQKALFKEPRDHQRYRVCKAVYSELMPCVYNAFQRADVFESEMIKYKEKYKAAKAALRSTNAERLAELQSRLDEVLSTQSLREEEARVRAVELQSALEQIQTVESNHAAELKAIQAETKEKVQQAKAEGWDAGRAAALAEGQAKIDAMIESFRNAKIGIERYAVREFVEGPAFDEANSVMGGVDLEAGFRLACNQFRKRGIIPEGFSDPEIGLQHPDPYPEPDEEETEAPVDIDWPNHKYGFAVDMSFARRDKRAPEYELPPPIDIESFLPPTRRGRNKSGASGSSPYSHN